MGAAGTVLAGNDGPGIWEVVQAVVGSRYQVHAAGTVAAAPGAIHSQSFDFILFILLDHRVPGLAGMDLLRLINRLILSPMVILMTGFDSEEVAIQAFRGGSH